jgi:hypothetical protein
LPPNSRQLLARLTGATGNGLEGWVLAGGTGLALHLGHRLSVDFDLFRTQGLDRECLRRALAAAGAYETLLESAGSLTVLAAGVKLSFFQVPDPFLFAPLPYLAVAVADVRDIALMKLVAIANRGSRRDFIDLYTILRSGLILPDYLALLVKKHGREGVNAYQVLKALTYFADAEEEPMPEMLAPFDWGECKAFFVREAHALVLP